MRYILLLLSVFAISLQAENHFSLGVEIGTGNAEELLVAENADIKKKLSSKPSIKVITSYKIDSHNLRISYLYNNFDSGDSYQSTSLGYKYDFENYIIVKNEYFTLIPALSYDSGISFEKQRDLIGWINEIEAGFNFELSKSLTLTCNYSTSVIFWQRDSSYTDIIDRVNERSFKFGLTYNFGSTDE